MLSFLKYYILGEFPVQIFHLKRSAKKLSQIQISKYKEKISFTGHTDHLLLEIANQVSISTDHSALTNRYLQLWVLGLVLYFLSKRQLRVVVDWKTSQENPVNDGVPQGSVLGPTLFLL